MPESPLPSPILTPSLNNKPLPSPPIAQFTTGSVEEPRSLIDASERPLLRSSPRRAEEWPVLFPQKATTPNTRDEPRIEQSQEPAQTVSEGQERYPRRSGSESASARLDQEPISKIPSAIKIQGKKVSATILRDTHGRASSKEGRKPGSVNPAPTQANKKSRTLPNQSKTSHRLSAGAAAVEKSSNEVNSIKEPRQTRTSSLRARISAGHVIKESPNKVLGFTDFTAEKVPSTKASKESLGSAAAFRTRASSSLSNAFTKKSSKDSLRASRAPAQFVAGSRRPVARRPSSRGSLRTDSRASSPTFLEPLRPAPSAPFPEADGSTRESSNPVSRNSVPNTVDQASLEGAIPLEHTKASRDSSNDFEIFEEKPNVPTQESKRDAPTAGNLDPTGILESIEESPQSTFRSKHISSKSPTFGPTLTISSSAHRLIMGTKDLNKENRPLTRKRSRDLFRAAVSSEHKGVTTSKVSSPATSKSTGRPLSSQGFPENRSRNESAITAPRAKKVKSADLSSISSSYKLKTESVPIKYGDAEEGKAASAADDPSSRAIQQRETSPQRVGEQAEAATESRIYSSIGITAPISPVKDSVTPVSDAIPVIPTFLPETLQEYVRSSDGASKVARVDEVKDRKARHCPIVINTDLQQASELSGPSTPKKGQEYSGKDATSPFPPRSSSRTNHPDYTINRSAKNSPTSLLERAAFQLRKEISASQSAEPKAADISDLFPPLNTAAAPSRHAISSQTILAEPASKRDSTARDSTRSQSSISKGLMFKARGLFHHKRTSDNNEVPNIRSTKKGSKRPTVTASGSPFASMSEIHPVHRPTQPSSNRNNTTVQRTSGHGMPPGAPDTPAFTSPKPTELSTTTALAMEMLESARKENSSPKKKRLLGMAEIVVDAITQARNAERAFEEAKQAARKAEVAHARCKRSVSDIAALVKEWKDDY